MTLERYPTAEQCSLLPDYAYGDTLSLGSLAHRLARNYHLGPPTPPGPHVEANRKLYAAAQEAAVAKSIEARDLIVAAAQVGEYGLDFDVGVDYQMALCLSQILSASNVSVDIRLRDSGVFYLACKWGTKP